MEEKLSTKQVAQLLGYSERTLAPAGHRPALVRVQRPHLVPQGLDRGMGGKHLGAVLTQPGGL